LLAKAKNPMLMVGDSVNASGAQDEAIALAEAIGAPVFECYASEYNVPSSHPLNLGSVNFVTPGDIRHTLKDCDVLMVVGAPLFQMIFPDPDKGVLAPGTKVVQLD